MLLPNHYKFNEFQKRDNQILHPLQRIWKYTTQSGIPLIGTSDHHQLYFYLLTQPTNSTNQDDILLNFDSHDDVDQVSNQINSNVVNIGNFVSTGFFDNVRKVWDHYIVVEPKEAPKLGIDNLGEKAERIDSEKIDQALNKALEQSRKKNSKIILTIDFDFFGANRIKDFDSSRANQQLTQIFTFVREHPDAFRLIHLAESEDYASQGVQQIQTLYTMISSQLEQLDIQPSPFPSAPIFRDGTIMIDGKRALPEAMTVIEFTELKPNRDYYLITILDKDNPNQEGISYKLYYFDPQTKELNFKMNLASKEITTVNNTDLVVLTKLVTDPKENKVIDQHVLLDTYTGFPTNIRALVTNPTATHPLQPEFLQAPKFSEDGHYLTIRNSSKGSLDTDVIIMDMDTRDPRETLVTTVKSQQFVILGIDSTRLSIEDTNTHQRWVISLPSSAIFDDSSSFSDAKPTSAPQQDRSLIPNPYIRRTLASGLILELLNTQNHTVSMIYILIANILENFYRYQYNKSLQSDTSVLYPGSDTEILKSQENYFQMMAFFNSINPLSIYELAGTIRLSFSNDSSFERYTLKPGTISLSTNHGHDSRNITIQQNGGNLLLFANDTVLVQEGIILNPDTPGTSIPDWKAIPKEGLILNHYQRIGIKNGYTTDEYIVHIPPQYFFLIGPLAKYKEPYLLQLPSKVRFFTPSHVVNPIESITQKINDELDKCDLSYRTIPHVYADKPVNQNVLGINTGCLIPPVFISPIQMLLSILTPPGVGSIPTTKVRNVSEAICTNVYHGCYIAPKDNLVSSCVPDRVVDTKQTCCKGRFFEGECIEVNHDFLMKFDQKAAKWQTMEVNEICTGERISANHACGPFAVAGIINTLNHTVFTPDTMNAFIRENYQGGICNGTNIDMNLQTLSSIPNITTRILYSDKHKQADDSVLEGFKNELRIHPDTQIFVGGTFNGIKHFAVITGINVAGEFIFNDSFFDEYTSRPEIFEAVAVTKATQLPSTKTVVQ